MIMCEIRVCDLRAYSKGAVSVGSPEQEEHQTSLDGRVRERKMGAMPRGTGVDAGKMCPKCFRPTVTLGAHTSLEWWMHIVILFLIF